MAATRDWTNRCPAFSISRRLESRKSARGLDTGQKLVDVGQEFNMRIRVKNRHPVAAGKFPGASQTGEIGADDHDVRPRRGA